ncbi:MAG: hypothetical protein ACI8ZB_004384 [Desulforhopalus sp.]|jgi:hypothetical protein
MIWENTTFNENLASAVAEFNRPRAWELCEELIFHVRGRDDPYPTEDAKIILEQLRGKRYFDLMQTVADALIQNQQTDARIRRYYCQSQLDLGNLTAAIGMLTALADETAPNGHEPNPTEYAEACGLLGRAYKDLYVLAGNPGCSQNRLFLEKAIAYYLGIYNNDHDKIWQGINSVALLRRADADGVELEKIADQKKLADSLATEILAEVKKRDLYKHADTWAFATAVEACIGLGLHEEALVWLMRYLKSDYTSAFELGSTYRQLTEIWQLQPGKAPGNKILPALKAALLQQQGCEIELNAVESAGERFDELTADSGYEKILGTEAFKSLLWLQRCMLRAKAVAKVEDTLGEPVGTAFLVRGGDFRPELGDELLLLTNAHVISENKRVSCALLPKKALLNFEMWKDLENSEFTVHQVWSSGPEELDATLIRPLPPIKNIEPMPVTDVLPLVDGQQRAYIIGHPQGRKLSFSIHDNYLLDYDERLLHYRSPSEPGNSGSPVFNDEWELIGLHHRGLRNMPRLKGKEGTYPANEGIWIQAIIGALKVARFDTESRTFLDV